MDRWSNVTVVSSSLVPVGRTVLFLGTNPVWTGEIPNIVNVSVPYDKMMVSPQDYDDLCEKTKNLIN